MFIATCSLVLGSIKPSAAYAETSSRMASISPRFAGRTIGLWDCREDEENGRVIAD
jgi:hypothetical protein